MDLAHRIGEQKYVEFHRMMVSNARNTPFSLCMKTPENPLKLIEDALEEDSQKGRKYRVNASTRLWRYNPWITYGEHNGSDNTPLLARKEELKS